jgi:hypothetical protein
MARFASGNTLNATLLQLLATSHQDHLSEKLQKMPKGATGSLVLSPLKLGLVTIVSGDSRRRLVPQAIDLPNPKFPSESSIRWRPRIQIYSPTDIHVAFESSHYSGDGFRLAS